MEALRSRLPQVPWFAFSEKERIAWRELLALQALELQAEALTAEKQEAWSRAARFWEEMGDSQRALAARRRWIERIPSPLRRARAWSAAGAPDEAVRSLEEGGGPDADVASLIVAAWEAERGGRWSDAAVLWRSMGRNEQEARCLARIASETAEEELEQGLPPDGGSGNGN
jgi:tetratricopeptide (TPR) repeat protein